MQWHISVQQFIFKGPMITPSNAFFSPRKHMYTGLRCVLIKAKITVWLSANMAISVPCACLKPNLLSAVHRNLASRDSKTREKEQGIEISTRTLKRTLNKNRLESHRPRKAPLLMPCHIKARLMYAKTFLDKESTFCDRILWSDKTKIEKNVHNDVKMIWRKRGEAFPPKNTVPTVKHGGGHVVG